MSQGSINRRWLTAFLVLAPAVGVAGACSFPDVTFDATSPAEAGLPDGGAGEGGADLDGALPPVDATSEKPPIEAGPDGQCLDPCDCDGDGFKSRDAACGEAGGTDCDDLDFRANPDAGLTRDLATAETRGDWNCDGNVTTEYPVLGSKCVDRLITSGCGTGLLSNVPCGTMGDLYTCQAPAIGLRCTDKLPPVKVLQRCK